MRDGSCVVCGVYLCRVGNGKKGFFLLRFYRSRGFLFMPLKDTEPPLPYIGYS